MALVSQGKLRMVFEFDLPEEIIERILYFMTESRSSDIRKDEIRLKEIRLKEAARTCILSKSWYSAWSNRPNLVLAHVFRSLDWFFHSKPKDDFPELARKTIQRYKDLNMKIQSLVLAMEDDSSKQGTTTRMLADELIANSLDVGLKELYVDIFFRYDDSYNITYWLPREVLASTTLTKLSVRRCKIDVNYGHISSGLVSLTLMDVEIDSYFFDEFSSVFPCIENLTLHHFPGYDEILISSESLKYLDLNQGSELKKVRLEVPNIRKLIFNVNRIPSLSVIGTNLQGCESHIKWTGLCEDVETFRVSGLRNFLTELRGSKIFINNCLDGLDQGRRQCLGARCVFSHTL